MRRLILRTCLIAPLAACSTLQDALPVREVVRVERPVVPRTLLRCPPGPEAQTLPPRTQLNAREAALARRELDWQRVHSICVTNSEALSELLFGPPKPPALPAEGARP